jgi:hypothetical protein
VSKETLVNFGQALITMNEAALIDVVSTLWFGAGGLLRNLVSACPSMIRWYFHFEGGAGQNPLKAGSRVPRAAKLAALLLKVERLREEHRAGDGKAKDGLQDPEDILALA